jgi:hypothetical protein
MAASLLHPRRPDSGSGPASPTSGPSAYRRRACSAPDEIAVRGKGNKERSAYIDNGAAEAMGAIGQEEGGEVIARSVREPSSECLTGTIVEVCRSGTSPRR